MKKIVIAALVASLALVVACAARPKDSTDGASVANNGEPTAKPEASQSSGSQSAHGIEITSIVNEPVQVNEHLAVAKVHMAGLTIDVPMDFLEDYTEEELANGTSFDFSSDDGAKMTIEIDGPGAAEPGETVDADDVIAGIPASVVRSEENGIRTIGVHLIYDTYDYAVEFSYPAELAEKYELFGDTFYTVMLFG